MRAIDNVIDGDVAVDMRRRDLRFFAAVIDIGVLPNAVLAWANGLQYEALARGLSLLILALLYAVLEATTGRTPGKFLLDLVVRRRDGSPIGLAGAFVRRATWMVPWAIGYSVGNGIGEVLGFIAVISVVWTTGRDPEMRGWHDRLASTVVVEAPSHASRSAKFVVVAALVVGVAAVALATP